MSWWISSGETSLRVSESGSSGLGGVKVKDVEVGVRVVLLASDTCGLMGMGFGLGAALLLAMWPVGSTLYSPGAMAVGGTCMISCEGSGETLVVREWSGETLVVREVSCCGCGRGGGETVG